MKNRVVAERIADQPVPRIETARLLLRAHRYDDFAACSEMWADPQITRFIGGKPATQAETWSKMLRYRGLWALLGFGYWAIEDKANHDFVGELGFADFKRDIQPSLGGLPEVGWAIVSAAHGKGFATEAAQAALAWSDRTFTDCETTCIVGPENIPSLRLADKLGFREYARAAYNNDALIIFRRAPHPTPHDQRFATPQT